jgi:hypothetical protein
VEEKARHRAEMEGDWHVHQVEDASPLRVVTLQNLVHPPTPDDALGLESSKLHLCWALLVALDQVAVETRLTCDVLGRIK